MERGKSTMEQLLQDRSVYQQLCKDYLNLKVLAQNACTSQERLAQCKELVRDPVYSPRKLTRIQRFGDLLRLLEQRNLLSMIKPEELERFEETLDSQGLFTDLKRYRQTLESHRATVERHYLEDLRHRDRRTLLEKEVERVKLECGGGTEESSKRTTDPPKAPSSSKRAPVFTEKRDELYTLLQDEIGRDWRTLARALNLTSTDIDELESSYRLRERILAVVERAEQTQGADSLEMFLDNLRSALAKCRRNDLVKKMDKMLQ
ncbi:uncharacterized protein LOC118466279 [Anopheles albimanus]|uniref:Uncharacterized protein n=1 Tax=Anopheles albimanus TaxID=7167 RepID=A0A182FGM2_ANOAL|nr:uncharacterized protein LOC118466279 [Anopheles albimanus]